jgi:predicted unusual protein kinase regulating ubiquinone biosynthesis (AarF/ABC1/UbiB family)
MGAGIELLKFAGIGAKAAVRRAFWGDDSERFLVDTLSGMPGAPAKIAQLMGMRAAHTIAAPEPMPLEEVKGILSEQCPALAASIESISSWSKTASIGQTHQARLVDGRTVAIKIQYPGVAKALSDQIDAIFGVAGFSPARRYAFDVPQTKVFMRQKLLEETDYRREATTQQKFFTRYRNSAVVIPEVYPEFSTAAVLTQSWESADSLEAVKKWLSDDLRAQAGQIMTSFLCDSLMGHGLIHTDLNPGNFGFRVDGDALKMVIYDYGSTYRLEPEQGLRLYRWLSATRLSDREAVWSALISLGFSAKHLEQIATKILPLSRVMLAPFIANGLWVAKDWRLQEAMDDILGQDKWWFRTAGPPWFLYLMRTFQGWHHALMTLDAAIDIAKIWWPWDQQFKHIVAFMGPQITIKNPPSKPSVLELTAQSLRVRVTEGAEEIVDLTLPARSVEDLESLMPDHVIQKCKLDGIDLRSMSDRVIREGGLAQELFSSSVGARHYRVWLT